MLCGNLAAHTYVVYSPYKPVTGATAFEMYVFSKLDRVSLVIGAELLFVTSPGLREKHRGIIVDYTAGMYEPSNEMYSVCFDGEMEIRYILCSDMQLHHGGGGVACDVWRFDVAQ